MLVNETPKLDFSPYGEFGNLRTDRDFDDFRLAIEFNVPPAATAGSTCAACTRPRSSTATAG